MLGGAVNRAAKSSSSESASRSSPSRSACQQRDPPPGSSSSSRSTSTAADNTPTSSTVPPSVSTVASTDAPPQPASHDVPGYISSQSHHHHPSTQTSTMTNPQQGHRPTSAAAPPPSHDPRSRPTDLRHPPQAAHGTAHTGVSMAQPGQSRMPRPQTAASASSPSSPRLQPSYPSSRSLGGSEATSPSRIKVRDLSHIQSFVSEELMEQSQRARRPGRGLEVGRQYEISSMPVTDIIEMVAGLLTKITTTNDMQHERLHRHIPPPDGASNLSPQASSVLAFHGKNVPSITILSYLTRIHKYCPTTYEVFLSLLVYFDRMTEMVNRRPKRRRRRVDSAATAATPTAPSSSASVMTPPSSSGTTAQDPKSPESSAPSSLQLEEEEEEEEDYSNFFVVDSFNIHRLVIAGVTCASKFFSDVFYTNSRYAKVGGLPLVELNHLELQFLLLNDFRLAVPVEELEAYGTMLVEFYAREVVAQQLQKKQAALAAAKPSAGLGPPGGYQQKRGESEYNNQTPTPPR
ncbi:Cyclin-dependent protein kinase complex component [Rasamsonia emersonii CBS 393.64]|uniref:Cyclin-dependent protein kinase complex component n=1 Tax=Rasamsonia emersonii (strain ATCC 16479 / CBS 393.64 / IMI 116815) TaxID=1408163 RepID=A0A0F4Z028_RASE3|nr:Cyclin-dependent protein kinase complex component [Rasamsonia emersonii CBS 393.64]KKA23700.1 Cyclin-dependent protein kinase complex component [Rasamsonia emersonii CBS 393.64]